MFCEGLKVLGSARKATGRTGRESILCRDRDFCVFLQVLGCDRGFLVAIGIPVS